jgi:hypothetical protein
MGLQLAQFRMVFYALALIVLMILRPQGLLGVHELWEVWPLNRLPLFRHRDPAAAPPPPPAAREVPA